MFVFLRPVRFADVDAARIVFFARYLEYCHDALEALFGQLPGGYAALTMERDVGIPSVHVEVDYRAVSAEDLAAHLKERLVTYKQPRSFEFVDEALRDDAGKMRRTALRDARIAAATPPV